MTTLGVWKVVGKVGIDTGMVMVADPCRALHCDGLARAFGEDWDGFTGRIFRGWKKKGRQGIALRSDTGHEGAAVVAGTGYGDGLYTVWGRFDGDICFELRVSFDGIISFSPSDHCDITGCAAPPKYLCDYSAKQRGKGTIHCNRWVCAKHRRKAPPGSGDADDFCLEHAKMARESKGKVPASRGQKKRANGKRVKS